MACDRDFWGPMPPGHLVGHRHFGRCRDASSLGCFPQLGPLEQLARPCRALVFSKEARSLGLPELRKTLGRGPVASSVLSSPLSSRALRSLPLRRQSTPSARRRPAT